MEKLFIIGISDNDRTNMTFELLSEMGFWDNYNVTFFTDGEGKNTEWASLHGFDVIILNPDEMYSSLPQLDENTPKVLLSFGWRKIFPAEFLNLFDKAVNFHDGLLPDYRGPQSYVHVYANLEKYYGVTAHYLDTEFDNGNIILQRKIKMFLDEEPEMIYCRVGELTAMMVPEVMRLLDAGFPGIKQSGLARYFFRIDRSEMDFIRQKNINHLRDGEPIELTPHKQWELL